MLNKIENIHNLITENKEKIKSTNVKVRLIYPLGSFALNLKPV